LAPSFLEGLVSEWTCLVLKAKKIASGIIWREAGAVTPGSDWCILWQYSCASFNINTVSKWVCSLVSF